MNAFCHVARTWAVWELRTKRMTRTAQRTYTQVLLDSLEKGWRDAADAHAETIARQKSWMTHLAGR